MALVLDILGVDKTALLKTDTLRIVKRTDGENNCMFVLITQAGTYLPDVGQEVVIEQDSVNIFGGIITTINKRRIEPKTGGTAKISLMITCGGYNDIPSRRTITAEYYDYTAGEIVEDLRALTIDGEGVGAGTINDGITIPYFLAVCKDLKEVYDNLAASSGYKWYIDSSKDLYFVSEETIVAADESIVEGGTYTDFNDVVLNESLSEYRNKTFVKGNFGADGKLVYTSVSDDTEITTRQTAEGGESYSSGVYGHVIEDSQITTESDATALATLDLKKHGFAPAELSFTSFDLEWIPGTKLTVNLPSMGITSDTYFLIEEVNIMYYIEGLLFSTVRATKRKAGDDFSTQRTQTGNDYFVKLVREAKKNGSGSGGGIAQTLQQAVKAYRDSNAALVTADTDETIVCSKEITLDVNSDMHITFSASLDIDDAEPLIVTAKTYITEV